MVPLLVSVLALGVHTASAADMDFGYTPAPGPGEKPGLLVTPKRTIKSLEVECTAGDESYVFNKSNLPAGKQVTLSWKRDTRVTSATCFVRAVFPDGYVDEVNLPIEYSYGGQLAVDLSRASANVKERTLAIRVSGTVERAEITAYGARKVILGQTEVELSGGPGEIEVPWVGDPADVVLLDVTLHSGNAWAGFTYSPWFLDIPHDDVLFESNSADIPSSEEYKLRRTLGDLQEVLEKYGEIVPVKLYIAGCTDTVGDGAHNRDLSTRRARAIGRWLRANGYDKPIFFHGFGEGLPAVSTGDGVDEARNRRALYMVGANPPPAGSGVPSVRWSAL
jgi:outer membrane protein OmpA-like peptidoglycan-associated protein